MSEMTDQFDADVAAVEPEMPVTFQFAGRSFTGQRTPAAASLEMEEAGYLQNYDDLQLMARLAIFTTAEVTAPAPDDYVVIGDVQYRIVQVTPSQDGVEAVYSLKASANAVRVE